MKIIYIILGIVSTILLISGICNLIKYLKKQKEDKTIKQTKEEIIGI